MLKTNLVHSPNQAPSLLASSQSCHSSSLLKPLLCVHHGRRIMRKPSRCSRIICCVSNEGKVKQQEAFGASTNSRIAVKAVVTVKVTMGGIFAHMGITRGLDDIEDLLGKSLFLVLVSQELDPRLRNPRIVRVSRSFSGKDRHSKISTVKGLKDKRVRLSVPTAIQLYSLQDKLGHNQPSKVVDWLLSKAQNEIKQASTTPISIP